MLKIRFWPAFVWKIFKLANERKTAKLLETFPHWTWYLGLGILVTVKICFSWIFWTRFKSVFLEICTDCRGVGTPNFRWNYCGESLPLRACLCLAINQILWKMRAGESYKKFLLGHSMTLWFFGTTKIISNFGIKFRRNLILIDLLTNMWLTDMFYTRLDTLKPGWTFYSGSTPPL